MFGTLGYEVVNYALSDNYSANESSDLQLFEVKTGKKIHLLKGQDSVPSTIEFFNEDGFFSAGYGNTIYYWYLQDFNVTE
ncbi:MAG: hypothetical protein K0U38_05585 [Epsilonproteobacteria bacterium]|nr:hypothetical protein [Campylobacterota bacterium]